jgi:hypothetical protein
LSSRTLGRLARPLADPLSEATPKETRQRMRDYQSLIDPNLQPDDE